MILMQLSDITPFEEGLSSKFVASRPHKEPGSKRSTAVGENLCQRLLRVKHPFLLQITPGYRRGTQPKEILTQAGAGKV